MKQIIIVKPKTLSAYDKKKLTKEGKIVIEHPAPAEVIFKSDLEIPYVYKNCCVCGERMYLPAERLEALKKSKASHYCSHGHGMSYQ